MNFEKLVKALQIKYPKFKVISKESSKLCRFLNFFIKFWNKNWMDSFTVTLGYTVYMPQKYINTKTGYHLLRHESVHVADFNEHPIWFPVSYLFLLPVFYTMREYWELRGYRETMLCEMEDTGTISDTTIEWLVEIFTGPSYFWMSKNKKRIKAKLEEIRQEFLSFNLIH